jgi:hypothetical protein
MVERAGGKTKDAMSTATLHLLDAALAPGLALTLVLLGRNPHPSRQRIVISLLLAPAILFLPICQFSVARWIAFLEPNPSVTLTALLLIAVIARAGGPKFFRPQDWKAAWLFGSMASLILYPTALGLTKFDAYALGWSPLLPLATAAVTTILLLTENRFGILLLLALGGMVVHPMESTNAWDCLIDPCYGIFSLVATLLMFLG